ncbi:transcription elongation factor SPT4 [Nematocida sp. LUAm3]|nr:transcription elongation factor SPT4 [Nematocida sp. LUAm3]KAI5173669.1 transcription elongation factor SPT4 [Nematocida sp. LUAm2]KAI5176890.1 transcription elongation factor SPT4 [Nematocida sp. LUAm1]
MVLPPFIGKRLRACLGCSLVKTQAQFKEEGCENCSGLRMKESLDNVLDCTSEKFSGILGVVDGKASWIAKWQHLEGYVSGMYAVTVEGDLPESKIMALERQGRVYIPRDKAFSI